MLKSILKMIASLSFNTAIHSVTQASLKGVYQPKEPEALLNYVKTMNEK